MIASYKKYNLKFNRPAGTSRGVMLDRDVWYIYIYDSVNDQDCGVGEVAPLRNLSCDDTPDLENKIAEVCREIENFPFWIAEGLKDFPSIRFGLETAILDFQHKKSKIVFPSEFTRGKVGIPINGLIWMGESGFMKAQIREKIAQGFRCIKLKIGAIDFDTELELLKMIRAEFPAEQMEIRVDANGAFAVKEAPAKLRKLAGLQIHSIEQPIKQAQFEQMAELVNQDILPIALDEELIGVNDRAEKIKLLLAILPDYIILKPSLHGGIAGCSEWIEIAESLHIAWWITSALESNVGLNAIAQWTFTLKSKLPQGLGTGQLFTNNISSPLEIKNAYLYYNPDKSWDLNGISDGL